MYSQRDEEKIILENTPAIGIFTEIGAYNAKVFSNTRALFEKGWSGVLVEPSPECFCGLMKEYGNHPRITLVNALLSGGPEGLTKFYSSPDAVGTANEGNYQIWKDGAAFTPIYMPSIYANKVFEALNLDPDFISIDTEGLSFDILKAIEIKPRCALICIEMDRNECEISDYLLARNFKVIHKSAENIIAKRIV